MNSLQVPTRTTITRKRTTQEGTIRQKAKRKTAARKLRQEPEQTHQEHAYQVRPNPREKTPSREQHNKTPQGIIITPPTDDESKDQEWRQKHQKPGRGRQKTREKSPHERTPQQKEQVKKSEAGRKCIDGRRLQCKKGGAIWNTPGIRKQSSTHQYRPRKEATEQDSQKTIPTTARSRKAPTHQIHHIGTAVHDA